MSTIDDIEDMLDSLIDIRLPRPRCPKVAIFGNSGTGKSTLCNALYGSTITATDSVEACTQEPNYINVPASSQHPAFILIDMPGIGEDPKHHQQYAHYYHSIVSTIDLALWVIKADDRSYASNLEVFDTLFQNHKDIPILCIVTQSDKTNDSEEWDYVNMSPSKNQRANLLRKQIDIYERFHIHQEHIITTAIARHGKHFNLDLLRQRLNNFLFPLARYDHFSRELVKSI